MSANRYNSGASSSGGIEGIWTPSQRSEIFLSDRISTSLRPKKLEYFD